MKNEIRVLLIEDSEDDAILIERELKKGGYIPRIRRVWSEDGMREAFTSETWDIIICDYMLPSYSTEDALALVKDGNQDIPFIIVSGAISEEVAVKMMKAGVHDYLKKDNLARLVPAIDREMKEADVRKLRRQAEDALRESEIRHRLLVKSLRDIVFVLDGEGRITEYYSSSAIRLDVDPSLIQGKLIVEVLPADITELFMLNTKRVLADGMVRSFEFAIEDEGEDHAHWVTLSPHEDKDRVVAVIHDVTELKKVEEELRATSNIATLYLDIMSHDIRNQLQAIKIGAELLSQAPDRDRSPAILEEIAGAVERCDELITAVHGTRDLLQTPLKMVSLCNVLIDCVQDFQEQQNGVIIEIDCRVSEAKVRADKYISLLLMNILENAVRHSEDEDTHIWVKLDSHEDKYEIAISDDGPGISDEVKKFLFDPNRRFGGVGIHQACQIAEKYGGHIEVADRIEGEPRSGAEFRVWLPRASNET